jgi:hypothetical protein
MTRDDRSRREGTGKDQSFRDVAGPGRHVFEDRVRARYIERHTPLIESLQRVGHSIVFTAVTRRGEAGTTIGVKMWCNNCWKRYRGPLHRWWGLSPRRPCS